MINKLKNFIQPFRETIYHAPFDVSKECKQALVEYTSYVSIAEDNQQSIGNIISTEQAHFTRKIIFTDNGPIIYTIRQKSYAPKKIFETYQGFVNYDGEMIYVDVTQHKGKKHYNGCKGYVITGNGDFDKISQTPTTKDLHYPDIDKMIAKTFHSLEKEIESSNNQEASLN